MKEERVLNQILKFGGVALLLGLVMLVIKNAPDTPIDAVDGTAPSYNASEADTESVSTTKEKNEIEKVFDEIKNKSGWEILDGDITDRIDDQGNIHEDEKLVNLRIKRDDFDNVSALIDTQNILEKLSKINEVYDVCVIWEGIGIDKYGNEAQEFMHKVIMKKETLQKINWENILLGEDIPKIADEYLARPQFR